jgi:tyrosyl-tRNA synthetase
MGVRLQMGGSDQWGNIINGIELARRMDGAEVFGLTTPLITKADGSKMGKSVSGAIWLNREQLPDYDYWQFWRNTDDRDVGRFLRLFTDLPMDEIGRLEALDGSEINAAKIALANAATELCRGANAAALAAETARKTFEEGASGGDLPTIDASSDISVMDALVALNFVASKKEARRMIQGGGARVEGDAVTDEDAMIAQQATPVKISAGKKKHGLIQFI